MQLEEQTPVDQQPLLGGVSTDTAVNAESLFSAALQDQLTNIVTFYEQKEYELFHGVTHLLTEVAFIEEHGVSGGTRGEKEIAGYSNNLS